MTEQIELHTYKGNVFVKLVTPAVTWYNIVSFINILGTGICKALPFFFAFTGCDTISAFHGKGKCTFWDHWMKSKAKDDLTRTHIALGRLPCSISNNDINTLETLVKSVYFGNTRNVNTLTLNQLRKVQFITSTSNDIRKIAASSSALLR